MKEKQWRKPTNLAHEMELTEAEDSQKEELQAEHSVISMKKISNFRTFFSQLPLISLLLLAI